MNTVCQPDLCTGCMACMEVCPKDAITIKDSLRAYNAEIDPVKCIGCNLCRKICQNNRETELVKPIEWHQGWAEDERVRAGGSSGGAASALMRAFVKAGGYACSCLFRDGEFVFETTHDERVLDRFQGSKYVKSNPRGAYRRVKELLQKGEKVLFIGLPCQVAALKIFVGEKLQENLYTVDLICHGTPSPRLLELFLRQYGRTLKDVKSIRFRVKTGFRVETDERGVGTPGVTDSYLISFLNGICYTESCYCCRYARTERAADITLGDSWGTDLAAEEMRQGISLILCQTEKGVRLMHHAGLKLLDVDPDRAIRNNAQLQAPTEAPAEKEYFFQAVRSGKRYDRIVFRIYPKRSLKETLKKFLIKMHLYRGGV